MLRYTSKKPILSTFRSGRFRQTEFPKDNFKVFKKDFSKDIIPMKREMVVESFCNNPRVSSDTYHVFLTKREK